MHYFNLNSYLCQALKITDMKVDVTTWHPIYGMLLLKGRMTNGEVWLTSITTKRNVELLGKKAKHGIYGGYHFLPEHLEAFKQLLKEEKGHVQEV